MKLSYKKILEKKDYLPFYVYDYETIKGQILKLKKNLPPNVKVYYSVKANPNIAILRIMKSFGLSAEIISLGELSAARKAGFSASDVIFAGSIKTDQEFLGAIEAGISLVSLESAEEIRRAARTAKRANKKQGVMIRFDLPQSIGEKNFKDYQLVSRFGLSLTELGEILDNFLVKFPFLQLMGVHVYKANRIFDTAILIEKARQVFSAIRDLEKKFDLKFKIIDIGGGFESNSRAELPAPDFNRKLRTLIDQFRLNDRSIILELGRYLINNAGSFITPVIESREEDNTVIVKGIINYLIRIFETPEARNWFREEPDNYSVDILPPRNRHVMPFRICGQLSSGADSFGGRSNYTFSIPGPKARDLVVIHGVGAYGLTQSLQPFGSRLTAAEFLLINGRLELIRDKGEMEDFLLHQRIPPVLK